MKILYIVGGEGNRYGSETIAIDLISAGKKNGMDYTVITANTGAVSETCNQLGIENHVVPFRFFVYKAMSNPLLNYVKRTIWKSRAERLTTRAVDIVEKKLDLKDFDLIHTNLSRDLLGGILAERNGIPHVWHIHELYKAHYQLSFLKKDQVKWMGEHADKFIAISKTVADEWIANGLPRERVTVIYNGIDISEIELRNRSFDDKYLKLVMVGHLVPPKGQELAIKGLAKLPQEVKKNIILDCYGEGTKEYKSRLQQLAKDLGITLSLKGFCSHIGRVLKEYDVGINYSRGEGFGLSTVEYMAAGVCPLVANTGANEELVEHEKNGFVFRYDDLNSFSEVVERLYKKRELLKAVSICARECAEKVHSISNMENKVFSIYDTVVRQKSKVLNEKNKFK